MDDRADPTVIGCGQKRKMIQNDGRKLGQREAGNRSQDTDEETDILQQRLYSIRLQT
jgi:hypothetical protein